jgi:hypothetical protein
VISQHLIVLKLLCKIHTNEVPLGLVAPSDFIELVVNQNVRPERPNLREAPQLSDSIWLLAQQCWVKDPHMRPSAISVCNALKSKLRVSESLFFLCRHFNEIQQVPRQHEVSSPLAPPLPSASYPTVLRPQTSTRSSRPSTRTVVPRVNTRRTFNYLIILHPEPVC